MLEKITQEQMEQHGVVSAPDELKGRPEDVKAVFDRLIREVVSKVINDIIDAHNGLDKDVNERIDGVIEELKKISEINAENLGANNITLDKKGETALAEGYGLTSLVPTVYEALSRALEMFVRKAGDTMTGPLEVVQNGTVAGVIAELASATILAFTEGKYSEHRRQLALCHTSDLSSALMLGDVTGDTGKFYSLLHTGNLEALGISRIVSGTVTGASKAGEDSPNSITFPFKPKLVYVTKPTRMPYSNHSSMKFDNFLWVEGVTSDTIENSNYGGIYRHYELDGNTLSWWVSDTKYAAAVCGSYVAIG